jgi:glycosyltransferase involved in cell wall biosynthesis
LTALSKTEHDIYWLRLEKDVRVQETRSLPQNIHPVDWREATTRTSWVDYCEPETAFRESGQRDQAGHRACRADPAGGLAAGDDRLPSSIEHVMGFRHPGRRLPRPDLARATRYVLKRSDWFTADCQTVRKIVEGYGFPPEHMTIFPWGVDQSIFQPKNCDFARSQIGFKDDLLLVHTRSWERRYGVDVTLEGFWRAYRQEPHIRMLMLGGGSQEKKVKQFVKEKGLEEHILFCGYKRNEILAQYYCAADVYLSASHIDGSSVALMEAMACGCPALVSDIPANLEWIHDGEEGWVFRDADPENLAERILEIARDKDSIRVRGEKAHQKALRDANWKLNFQKLLKLTAK